MTLTEGLQIRSIPIDCTLLQLNHLHLHPALIFKGSIMFWFTVSNNTCALSH